MEVAKLVLEYIRTLIWPTVVLSICLVFRSQLVGLLNRIRHAELPGGVAVDLDQEIKDVKALSARVQVEPVPNDRKREPSIPINEANARMMKLGLRPSPTGLDLAYYRTLAEQDPNIALAGLRMEIDILARNVAKGFKVEIGDRDSGTRLARRLNEAHAISNDQMQLITKIMSVCNAAVHGSPVSREEAEDVIDSAGVLAEQYLSWLSWGFDDGWKPKAERCEPKSTG
jgi:hypothetical protein